MIQKSAAGSCGRSASRVVSRVPESRKSAPPTAVARGPSAAAPAAIAVSSRLYAATGTRSPEGGPGHTTTSAASHTTA